MKEELKVLGMIAVFAILGLFWGWLSAARSGMGILLSSAIPALALGTIFGVGVVTPFLVVQNHLEKAAD